MTKIVLNEQQWYKVSPYYHNIVEDSLVNDVPRRAVLFSLLSHCFFLNGEVWECGVYKGGTAGMFAHMIKDMKPTVQLRLFDTFTGLPDADLEKDEGSWIGMFNDTSAKMVTEKIQSILPSALVYEGYIPDTFKGLDDCKIAFAHIDTDMYKSYIDCLEFIWPRMAKGGVIVFDDYGYCPGARKAVQEFFLDKAEKHVELETIQAFVVKN
jgi:O-methyltransferase